MWSRVYLLLGSNLGNPRENILNALERLSNKAAVIHKTSSFYRTAAWGKNDQPDFLNIAVEVLTPYPPQILLRKLLSVERDLGRVREEKWGPRIIDIDILLYGSRIIRGTALTVPHPGLPERRFVLQPLSEIAGSLRHPQSGKNIRTLLAECSDPLPVKKERP